MPRKTRNVVAAAHSLRGGAGAGAHNSARERAEEASRADLAEEGLGPAPQRGLRLWLNPALLRRLERICPPGERNLAEWLVSMAEDRERLAAQGGVDADL